ncbi:MAG: recombinase RecT [Escherichia coli]
MHIYCSFGNKNEKSGKKNVQLIIGYRGMIDLARRSGQIASLSARVVREGDEFNFEFGLDEKVNTPPRRKRRCPGYPRLCCRKTERRRYSV